MRTAVVVAAVLLAAACSGGEAAAATVNGTDIPAAELDRDLRDLAANRAFVEGREAQGVAFRGARPGTYDAAIVAELLSRKVTAVLVHEEVVRRGLATTAEDRAAAERTLREQVVVGPDATQVLDGFPRRYVDAQVTVQAESRVLQADEERVGGSFEGLLRRLRATADVTVAARYGRWDTSDPERIRLVPPAAPASRVRVPTTSAAP